LAVAIVCLLAASGPLSSSYVLGVVEVDWLKQGWGSTL